MDTHAVTKAAELINKAEKPFIVWGQGGHLGGCRGGIQSLYRKVRDSCCLDYILGLSALPTAHPLNVGMVGMHGNYGPNLLTNECDLLIAVGMRFDDRVTGNLETYAKQAKIIHFEIDPAEINKNVMVDVPVLGDCKKFRSFDSTDSNPTTNGLDVLTNWMKVEVQGSYRQGFASGKRWFNHGRSHRFHQQTHQGGCCFSNRCWPTPNGSL